MHVDGACACKDARQIRIFRSCFGACFFPFTLGYLDPYAKGILVEVANACVCGAACCLVWGKRHSR